MYASTTFGAWTPTNTAGRILSHIPSYELGLLLRELLQRTLIELLPVLLHSICAHKHVEVLLCETVTTYYFVRGNILSAYVCVCVCLVEASSLGDLDGGRLHSTGLFKLYLRRRLSLQFTPGPQAFHSFAKGLWRVAKALQTIARRKTSVCTGELFVPSHSHARWLSRSR